MVDEQMSSKEEVSRNVPKPSQKIRDFWPKTRKRALLLTISMEAILAVVVVSSLMVTGVAIGSTQLVFVTIAILAAAVGINIVLAHVLLAPLKDLSAALTHISGEPSDVIPPNSTAIARQYDGLEPLLELIYGLSSQQGEPYNDAASNTNTAMIISRGLDQTSGGLVICNEDGTILYASQHAPVTRLEGTTPELSLIFDVDQSFNEWLETCRNKHVKSEFVWRRVADRLAGDPDRRIYDVIATYEKGSPAPVVILAYDRTMTYQPEDDQLDFISFAAHELRGPVTVIRGYLDVFREELENPTFDVRERKALLSRLIVSSNRLSGYITNILNTSRYDRRHLKVNLREYTLSQIYSTIADDMSLRASTQNRLLTIQLPSTLPTVAADPSSLSEVFSNLIDNALKYSHEGGTVTVSAAADRDFVVVSVTDHGIGMPSSVVGNLFHKFYRSHRSRETVSGTGIGLYIAKAIVETHGGVIEAKSVEGRGSTFSFSVPIYASVADKLAKNAGTNAGIVRKGNEGWIKNHAKIRG